MTTNGMLSKDQIDFIAENFDFLMISYDGLPEIHNRNRISPHRRIGSIIINIAIEDSLYEKEHKIFDSLFRSYSLFAGSKSKSNKEYFYYIYDKKDQNDMRSDYGTVCDINRSDWIFILTSKLEIFYATVLKCTVIHSSCVRVNDKNILLMGARYSGKTTLTKYLTIDKNGEILDDDCVYIVDNSYVGFCMPLSMRNVENSQLDEHVVGQTTDEDEILRTLYSSPKYAASFSNIDMVVFPRYGIDKASRKEKITHAKAFNKIIKNIRAHHKMEEMFADVKNLVRNSDCFVLEYANSDLAYKLLFDEMSCSPCVHK